MTRRRITVVSSEPLGRAGTGGAGTADSLLAVALGRHGHDVELLIATGRLIGHLNAEWTRKYDSAGVQVRLLDRLPGVRPRDLAPTLEVFQTLRDRPPDVAIVNDWRGLGYAAMRSRQLGRTLTGTAFIVHCHGPGRVLAEFAGKVPDTIERFREEVMERASLELADAVVSPSTWLLDWMRAHRWPVPDNARVIQYPRQSVALGETPSEAPDGTAVTRLAFFGQLREGKGIRVFLEAIDMLEPDLLDGVKLLFLGAASARWSEERIRGSVSDAVAQHVAAIRLETSLDRDAALAELRRPGTLAIMPSLLDNSPNTVSECIEQGIPFIATATGGIAELVAEGDRGRVLCEPTSGDLAAALRRALTSRPAFAPARPAQSARVSLVAWLELVETIAPRRQKRAPAATHMAIVATGGQSVRRARRLAAATRSVQVDVVPADSRSAGLAQASADWILFLDDDDEPDEGILEILVAAQASAEADVVTTAVQPKNDPAGIQLFLGDPGALGLVENQYGVLGLIRRSLAAEPPEGTVDPDWPLFARAALQGARIVSIPEPLSQHSGKPGEIGDVPGEALLVLAAYEESGRQVEGLPQLGATLAAAHARAWTSPVAPSQPGHRLIERSLRILRTEGTHGLARKAANRIRQRRQTGSA
jgi:glycosyltransferase involved in cell wall biosynthesis